VPHVRVNGVRLFYQETGAADAIEQAETFNGICLEFFQKHRGA